MGVFEAIDETFEKFEKTMGKLFDAAEPHPTPSRSYRVTRDDVVTLAIEVDVPGASCVSVFASSRDVVIEWRRGESKKKLRLTFGDEVRRETASAVIADGVLTLDFLKAKMDRVEVKVVGRDGREI